MEKIYVEFEFCNSDNMYSMQSKYFNTEEEAIAWYKNSFDYVNIDDVVVSLMKALFDNDDNLDEIIRLYDITAKFNLKGE